MSIDELEQQAIQLTDTELQTLISRLTLHRQQRVEQSVPVEDEALALVRRYDQCLDALLAINDTLLVEPLLARVQALLSDLEDYGRRAAIDVYDLAVYEYLAGIEELLADQQERNQTLEPGKDNEYSLLTLETQQALQTWRINQLI